MIGINNVLRHQSTCLRHSNFRPHPSANQTLLTTHSIDCFRSSCNHARARNYTCVHALKGSLNSWHLYSTRGRPGGRVAAPFDGVRHDDGKL